MGRLNIESEIVSMQVRLHFLQTIGVDLKKGAAAELLSRIERVLQNIESDIQAIRRKLDRAQRRKELPRGTRVVLRRVK
jgi:hypothetical protein